jgi:hypothetical protein
MTAHAGAALSHVIIFGAAAPCPTAILRHENCNFGSPPVAGTSAPRKICSIGDCMAAMGQRLETEGADRFHLRITCGNLASGDDDFIRK